MNWAEKILRSKSFEPSEKSKGNIPEKDNVYSYLRFLHRRAERFSENIHGEVVKASWKILAGIYFGGFGLLNYPERLGGGDLLINIGLGIWGLAEGAVNISRAVNNFNYSRQLHEEIRTLTGSVPLETSSQPSAPIVVSPSVRETCF